MTRDRATRALGAVLGFGFVAFGIVETGVAVAGRDGIGFFWFPALCGGGVLVLLGVFRVTRPHRASIALVTLGALAGALATAWTVVVPVLAVALIALVAGRKPQPVGGAAEAEAYPPVEGS